MRVLNLLCGGGTGGIEVQCLEHGKRSGLDHRYLILWKPGEISQEMEAAGLNVEVYNTNPKRYLSDFFRFIKKCKSEKIDVLVCHQVAPLITLYVIGLKIFLPKIRIVGYSHSNANDWCKRDIILRRIVWSFADKVVCISQTVLDSVKSHFCISEKLVLIYNGVNTDKFKSAEHLPSKACLRLIYVGRLIQEKGVENIIRGVSQLPQHIPVHLQIVGDGPHRPALEQFCQELGIQDYIEFLGNQRDIPTLYKNADIFVHLPNWQEGFGLTIVEAMAAGLVCIVNQHGALPEIVNHMTDGFIVDENNTLMDILGFIVDQMQREDSEKLNVIRENARNRANTFSLEKYTQKLDNLLCNL